MREIKFRAWNVNTKRMADWEEVENEYGFKYLLGNNITIPMQYTGLKDKNGVEIYDGDVVGKEVGAFQPLRKIRRDFVVEWQRKGKESGMWELLLIKDERVNITKSYYEPFGLGCEPQNYEVIGNIHENPELLTCK
jgi:uncharacterized phage protein (TIGR01671 family)